MERKIFDPKEWLTIEKPVQQAPKEVPVSHSSFVAGNNAINNIDITEIESIVQSIEEKKLDITASYTEWRNIGFALASGLGEGGRDYFHRVSCFFPKYSKHECDQQYDKCLKGKGNGISMKSFFYYAKQGGIEINRQLAMGNGQEEDNGQLATGNRQEEIDNGQLAMDNRQEEIDNRQFAMGKRLI